MWFRKRTPCGPLGTSALRCASPVRERTGARTSRPEPAAAASYTPEPCRCLAAPSSCWCTRGWCRTAKAGIPGCSTARHWLLRSPGCRSRPRPWARALCTSAAAAAAAAVAVARCTGTQPAGSRPRRPRSPHRRRCRTARCTRCSQRRRPQELRQASSYRASRSPSCRRQPSCCRRTLQSPSLLPSQERPSRPWLRGRLRRSPRHRKCSWSARRPLHASCLRARPVERPTVSPRIRSASRFPSRYAATLPSRDVVGGPLSRALVPATARFGSSNALCGRVVFVRFSARGAELVFVQHSLR